MVLGRGACAEGVGKVDGGAVVFVEEGGEAGEVIEADFARAAGAELDEDDTDVGAPVQRGAAVCVLEVVLVEWDKVLDEGFVAGAHVEGVDR